MMPDIVDRSAGPRPVEMLEMDLLTVIGRFPGETAFRLRGPRDVASLALPEGLLQAGLQAFFALGGREAVSLPSPTLEAQQLPERTALLAVPEADGDWALLAPHHAIAAKAGAMLLVDPPESAGDTIALQGWRKASGVDWADAAAFAPWLLTSDGSSVPPSMAAAGLIARVERQRGIWKSPAGVDAPVDPLRPASKFADQHQQLLNPLGVNLFRTFPERGSLLFGSRTLSDNPEWRYIPVRRLNRMIERSLAAALAWVVFEPNDEPLWADVRRQADEFLHRLWRHGALAGSQPADSYFVRCDASTTTAADIANGQFNILWGVAPQRPAEFIVTTLRLHAAVA